MAPVFRAVLLCSDGDCAELFEAYGSLEEIERLACECDCSLELVEVSEVDGQPGGFDLAPLR